MILNFWVTYLVQGQILAKKINDPSKPNHGQNILSYLDTKNYLRSEDDTEIKKILRAALSEDSRAQPWVKILTFQPPLI